MVRNLRSTVIDPLARFLLVPRPGRGRNDQFPQKYREFMALRSITGLSVPAAPRLLLLMSRRYRHQSCIHGLAEENHMNRFTWVILFGLTAALSVDLSYG